VTVVDLSTVEAQPAGAALPVVAKTEAFDLRAAMLGQHGWISDKVEGLGITLDGTVYAVIDNDGVDDAPGETQFLTLGNAADLFN
jgi:hypothetical protein